MAEVALAAAHRQAQGSSNSRRLRSSGQIPGVVYGHGIDPTPISVVARELRLALNTDAGVNALISLDVEGKKHLAMARALQYHPVRNTVAHVDFQVVNRNETMQIDVPLAFIGDADKVTKSNGLVEHLLQSLTVSTNPTNIPAHLEVDISNLEIDEAIRVKDIKLPSGVTTDVDGEEPVVVGKQSRAAVEAEAADAETAAAAEASGEGSATASADTDAEAVEETEEK